MKNKGERRKMRWKRLSEIKDEKEGWKFQGKR